MKNFAFRYSFYFLILTSLLFACEDSVPEGAEGSACGGFTAEARLLEGEISLVIDDGMIPYAYEILYQNQESQSGVTSAQLTEILPLFSQSASVVITDSNDCLVEVSVVDCSDIMVTVTQVDSEILVNVTGGKSPYQYVIEYQGGIRERQVSFLDSVFFVNRISQDAEINIGAIVTITDDNDCSQSTSIIL